MEQYLGPNLPPNEEIDKMFNILEWCNDVTFPLSKDMKVVPNAIITRESQNLVRQEKRDKKGIDMLVVNDES